MLGLRNLSKNSRSSLQTLAGLVLFKAKGLNTKGWIFALLISAIVLSGCSTSQSSNTEGENPKTLIRIAQKFNDDYRSGDFGSVYDRWNAHSHAIISRSDYIRRHVECPNNPKSPTHVSGASQRADGKWLVRYTIGESSFTDYWSYVQSRWQFDLIESNPDSVTLYKLSFAAYALKIGCVSS